jgi:hypothetical protein
MTKRELEYIPELTWMMFLIILGEKEDIEESQKKIYEGLKRLKEIT